MVRISRTHIVQNRTEKQGYTSERSTIILGKGWGSGLASD
jgi:hypothetical protein